MAANISPNYLMNHSHYGTVRGGSQQRFEHFRKLVISHKKAPQSLWKTASTAGERLLRLRGGGDAVYATTANKGHTEIVFMWKMENFCFSTEENYGILSPLFYRRYNSDTVNFGEAGSEEN